MDRKSEKKRNPGKRDVMGLRGLFPPRSDLKKFRDYVSPRLLSFRVASALLLSSFRETILRPAVR